MGAQRMGFFTRAEFKQGLAECGATSVAQLRKALPRLAEVDDDPHAQEALHQWAFRYCLTVRGRPGRPGQAGRARAQPAGEQRAAACASCAGALPCVSCPTPLSSATHN